MVSRWYLVTFIVLLLLREADLHVRFTESSIFGSRLYFQTDTSILTIVLGTAIILLVLCVLFLTMTLHFRDFVRQVFRRVASAWFIALALFLAILARSVDGVKRKLAMIHVDVSREAEFRFMQLEEIAEMGIPLALCIAAIFCFKEEPTRMARIQNPELTLD